MRGCSKVLLQILAVWIAWGTLCRAQMRDDLLQLHDALGIAAAQAELARQGMRAGEGLRVAVIDDGFCLNHVGLKHLQDSGIADAWDYFKNSGQAWDAVNRKSHGAATLGVLGSKWDSLPGIIPAAKWLLYRTEVDTFERTTEEDWLSQALLRAVDSGAGVISISLGYRYGIEGQGDLSWTLMDGWQRPESRAVRQAAARGAVVVVAMGNDGLPATDGLPTLSAPADADSIISVGAVSEDGGRCGFSSVGNAADGRIKPDVVAFGCPVPLLDAQTYEGAMYANGTSFATPLLAGMAGLLRQLYPRWTPQQVIAALKQGASQAAQPDSLLGSGIPDLRKSLTGIVTEPSPRPHGVFAWMGRQGLRAQMNVSSGVLACYDVRGNQVWSREFRSVSKGHVVSDLALPHGISVLRWRGEGSTQELKVLSP